jgi:hypothetical protein
VFTVKLPKDNREALVRMAQNGMHSGIAKALEVQVTERVKKIEDEVRKDEREKIAHFLRNFPEAILMAGHRVFDVDVLAMFVQTGNYRQCPDCGGEGGGGTMDPDVWIECTTCKAKGTV